MLAARGADCPVVICRGGDGEPAMLQALREADLRVEAVRRGGEACIRRDWLPVVERLVARVETLDSMCRRGNGSA